MLLVGPDGHLVIDHSIRLLFDYYLAAMGEEPEEAIRDRIIARIRHHLREPAVTEAIDLLDRYLAMQKALRSAVSEHDVTPSPRTAHALAKAVRRRFLSDEEVFAFFGEEEQYGDLMLTVRDTYGPEAEPSREQKSAEQALNEGLSLPQRQARQAAMRVTTHRAAERQLREQGADDREIEALRIKHFGVDAAVRLRKLDRQRAAWQARVAQYERAVQAIAADSSMSRSARFDATEALIKKGFSPEERLRLRALLRLRND